MVRMRTLLRLALIGMVCGPTAVALALCLLCFPAQAETPDIVWKTTGHSDWVQNVAFSPYGNILASSGRDRSIKLWRASDGAPIRTLTGHTGDVPTIFFSPDGSLIASGSVDRTIKLWSVPDGTLIRTLWHGSIVTCVAFSPDGTLLASAGVDRTIRLWRVSDGALIETLLHDWGVVYAVVFSPDGTLIASGGDDRVLRLWQVSNGTLQKALTGHTEGITSIDYSPDGMTVASSSWDRTIRLWRVSDGALIRTLTGHTDTAVSVRYSPNGALIVSTGDDKTIRFWSTDDGVPLKVYYDEAWGGAPCRIAFSPDGRLFGYGCRDGTVVVARNPFGSPAVGVALDVPECACDVAGYQVNATYTVEGIPSDGKLEIYKDAELVDTVVLDDFVGTAAWSLIVPTDTWGAHTWKAVLDVTTQSGATAHAEDEATIHVCQTPVVLGIPDQTAPFVPFDLDDYIVYEEGLPVIWTTSGVPEGWSVSIDENNVATVTAPPTATEPATITFTASVMCCDSVVCRDSDSAVFTPVLPVVIDIKPGSLSNPINLCSKGVIPVAILTTPDFNAAVVNPATVHFGATGTEAAPVQYALEDVDEDGDIDMILHFRTQDFGFVPASTEGVLTGKTLDAKPIKGTDSVRVVPE